MKSAAIRIIQATTRILSPERILRASRETIGRPSWFRSSTALVVAVLGGVAIIRIALLDQLPLAADLVRHVIYGRLVWDHGLALADVPLSDLVHGVGDYAFSAFPYNYPPGALLFFSLTAAVSPTIYSAKVALTAVEALNATLLWRLSGSRALGIVYWASPASIWWVTHEGQFEPVQTVLALTATLLLSRGLAIPAFALLGLAIQVKLTAALLLPWFLVQLFAKARPALGPAMAALLLSFLPTALAELAYSPVYNVWSYASLLAVNPYFLDPWSREIDVARAPTAVRVANQLYSWAMIAFAAAGALRLGRASSFVACLGFLVILKIHPNVMPWYVLVLAPLSVPILLAADPVSAERRRRIAFGVAFLTLVLGAEPSALGNLVAGTAPSPRWPAEIGLPEATADTPLRLHPRAP